MPGSLHHNALQPLRSAADTTARSTGSADSSALETSVRDSTMCDTVPSQSVDHSSDFPFALYCTADSLRLQLRAEQSTWRDVSVKSIYGQPSMLALTPRSFTPARQTLTGNVVYQGFVLALAVTYALLLYRNLGDIRMLLERITRNQASGKRLSEDPGTSGVSRFLNLTTTIGILFMGVLVIKYGDSLMPVQLAGILPHTAVLALSLLSALAWCVIALYQYLTVNIIGVVTLSKPFTTQLQLLKRTYFSLLVVITSPALLLFALCPYGTGGFWFLVVAAEATTVIILYLKEILNLFLSKKISILHWFLYLCIVEILPISFVCLLVARG